MLRRNLMVAVAMILVLGFNGVLWAQSLHVGKVVSVGKNVIIVHDKRDMDDDKIHVTADTKITKNGKIASLSDIQVGDVARIEAAEFEGKLTAKTIDANLPE